MSRALPHNVVMSDDPNDDVLYPSILAWSFFLRADCHCCIDNTCCVSVCLVLDGCASEDVL
jgi:hypothetical protein